MKPANTLAILLVLFPLIAFAGGDFHISTGRVFVVLVMLLFFYGFIPIFNISTVLDNILSSNKFRFCTTRIALNLLGISVVGYDIFVQHQEYNDHYNSIPMIKTIYLVFLSIILIVDLVRSAIKGLKH